jgi:hypothetical protein
LDAQGTATELWNAENTAPVAGGALVLDVDTTHCVDIDLLVRRIRSALAGAEHDGH